MLSLTYGRPLAETFRPTMADSVPMIRLGPVSPRSRRSPNAWSGEVRSAKHVARRCRSRHSGRHGPRTPTTTRHDAQESAALRRRLATLITRWLRAVGERDRREGALLVQPDDAISREFQPCHQR